MLEGKNKSLSEQMKVLEEILKMSPKIIQILEILEKYSKENPNFKNYYLAAGCINQTIFNYYHNMDLDSNIKDYDIVYFDEDTSYEAEDKVIKDLTERLGKLKISHDIKNQKIVPIWYKEKYGIEREAYKSAESAIARWGASITCIGVRLENKKLIIASPYGLNDLFDMIIRPVTVEYDREKFMKKCQRWQKCWPKLKLVINSGFPKDYVISDKNNA